MPMVSVERDARQCCQGRGMPALDATLARGHPGPHTKLACMLEFALPGTALIAIEIAEVSARHAKFAFDALKALRSRHALPTA
jgi:hypothetical protein